MKHHDDSTSEPTPKNKRMIIISVIAAFVLIVAGIVVIVVFTHHDDISMSGQLDKAMENKGYVSIVTTEGGSVKTYTLNKWEGSYTTYVMNKAYLSGGSIVIEKYTTTSPDKKGTLTSVDYYSTANVITISYVENETTYTWHR